MTSETGNVQATTSSYLQFLFGSLDQYPIKPILQTAEDEFGLISNRQINFTKTVKWSPDGLCLLSNSEDNRMRLFEIPTPLLQQSTEAVAVNKDWRKCLSISESGTIYDYDWYPFMNSSDPGTCCFLTASNAQPIHMWDAFNGQLRQSYTCVNQYDEVVSPLSVSFNAAGDRIYCGVKDGIKIFDTLQPGRNPRQVACVEKVMQKSGSKMKSKLFGQTGLISCLAFNSQYMGMYAAGSYDKTVGLYDEDQENLQLLLEGHHRGGITQVKFSTNGILLFSGARKDDTICCWDIRNTIEPLFLFDIERKVKTNQKIIFDVDIFNQYLITGSDNGQIWVFDLQGEGKKICSIETGQRDSINATVYHPYLPYIAASSGERKFITSKSTIEEMVDSDEESDEIIELSRITVLKASYKYFTFGE
jgi:WD40 repeat protein